MYEPHLFEDGGFARLSSSEEEHLDLIPQVHFVPLQLVLNLLVPRLALLALFTLTAAHCGCVLVYVSKGWEDECEFGERLARALVKECWQWCECRQRCWIAVYLQRVTLAYVAWKLVKILKGHSAARDCMIRSGHSDSL